MGKKQLAKKGNYFFLAAVIEQSEVVKRILFSKSVVLHLRMSLKHLAMEFDSSNQWDLGKDKIPEAAFCHVIRLALYRIR